MLAAIPYFLQAKNVDIVAGSKKIEQSFAPGHSAPRVQGNQFHALYRNLSGLKIKMGRPAVFDILKTLKGAHVFKTPQSWLFFFQAG